MSDSLIYFGDSVKALDENGKVGGYLVRFSTKGRKDLDGEYFTADTYFGPRDGDGADTVFHHGLPLPVKTAGVAIETIEEIQSLSERIFAPVKTKKDAVGIWAETVLNLADAYEAKVYELVKKKKLGWSSGAVSHLVRKEKDGKLKRWIIGEASLTPTPAEPMNRAVTVKSIDTLKLVNLEDERPELETANIPEKPGSLAAKLNQLIDDRVDDGHTKAAIIERMAREAGIVVNAVDAILDGIAPPTDARLKAFSRVLDVSFEALKAYQRRDHSQSIKGMFEEALAEQTPSRWELESTYCRIIKKLANAAAAAQLAGITFDLSAKVKEATDEYTALLGQHALVQIESWMEAGGNDDFYLKAIIDTAASVKALAGADLDTHSQLAVSALRDILGRFRGAHENRVKAGRVLSEKNRNRVSTLMGDLQTIITEMQALLDDSTPKATDAEQRAAMTKTLRLKWQARQLGATSNG